MPVLPNRFPIRSTVPLLALTAAVLILAGPALAQDSGQLGGNNTEVFTNVSAFGVSTFKNVRNWLYVLAAFGMLGFVVAAFFKKVDWKWVAYWAMGLVILVVLGSIFTWIISINPLK